MESDLISWIVEQLVSIVLTAVTMSLTVISDIFEMEMAPQADASTTLDKFFDTFLPNPNAFWNVMVACGLLIAYAILIFQLFKGLFGPIAKAESPVRLVVKTLFVAVVVANAKGICDLFFWIVKVPYEEMVTGAAISQVQLGNKLEQMITGFISGLTVAQSPLADLVLAIFSIILLFSILVNYVKLIIEIAERYVITGILCLFSPLCLATAASDNTSNIAKSWVKMMISQTIVMCMSTFFISIFEASVMRATGTVDFLTLILLLAWLRTGQRIDAHMSTLGLTTAQAGNGLYGDMMAGVGTMRALSNGAKKAASVGTGVAMAGGLKGGGLRNYAASSEGKQMFGAGISRMAQAGQDNAGKQMTAAFEARTNPFGQARGAIAQEGAKAKYGDTNIKAGKDGAEGVSLNDRLAAGDQIKSAQMDEHGAVLNMTDKDGNEYQLRFGDTADGGAVGQFDGSEEALSNVFGLEPAGEMNAQEIAEGLNEQLGEAATADAGDTNLTNADGENLDGKVDANGNPVDGTNIQDESGITAGIADGEGNMQVEGAMAMGADGQMHDVSAAMDENGNLRTNDQGQLVDSDGNVLTDSQGNALTAQQDMNNDSLTNGAMAMGADGQMHDVSAAVDENGSLMTNDQGQLVDSDGNVLTDSQGNAISAGNTMPAAMGADGQMHDVSAAMKQDGTLATNDQGQLVNAKTGEALKDSQGNAISAQQSAVPAAMGADGQMHDASAAMKQDGTFATNAQGQLVNAQTGEALKDSQGNAISASAGGTAAAMRGSDGQMHDVSAAMKQDGTLATNAQGQLVNAQTGAVMTDSKGNAITAGNVTTGARGTDGQIHAAGAGVATNAQGQLVNAQTGAVMTDSNGKPISASNVSAAPMARGTDGQMHNVSAAVTSSGALSTNAQGQLTNAQTGALLTDSKGQAISTSNVQTGAGSSIKTMGTMADGSQVDLTGKVDANGKAMGGLQAGDSFQAGGQTFNVGANGSVTQQGASAPLSSASMSQATTMGTMAKGADGQMHDISGSLNASGTGFKAGAVQSDGQGGAFVTAADGSRIAVSGASQGADGQMSGGHIAGGTYNAIAGQSGLSVQSNPAMVSASAVTGTAGGANATTYNQGGSLALGADGKMHDVSNFATSSGAIKAGTSVQTDAAGNSYVTASDGAHIAVSGSGSNMQVASGTYSQASGQTGAFAVQQGSSVALDSNGQVAGGVSASISPTTPTYNSGGSMAVGSDGQMHDVSSYVNNDGSIKSGTSVQTDSYGNSYISTSDGAHIEVSGSGATASVDTFSLAQGNTGEYVLGHTSSGAGAMIQTDGAGGIPASSSPVATMSFMGGGNAESLSASYSQSSGGDFVKSSGGDDYARLSSDGGRSVDGGVQRYAKTDGPADFTDSSGQGYAKSDSGTYAMVDNGDGSSRMMNCGNGISNTYSQNMSYDGLPVVSNGQGGYGLAIGANAHATSTGNGEIHMDLGNGMSCKLSSTAVCQEPYPNAQQVTFNGKSYYVQATSSTADAFGGGGTVASRQASAERAFSTVDAQTRSLMTHTDTVRGATGNGAYVPATTSGNNKGYAQYVADGNNGYRVASRAEMSDSSIPKFNRHSVDSSGRHDGFVKSTLDGKGEQKIQTYRTSSGAPVQDMRSYANGSFSFSGAKNADGSRTVMHCFPAGKFTSSDPMARKATVAGKECYVVMGKQLPSGETKYQKSSVSINKNFNAGPAYNDKFIKVRQSRSQASNSRTGNVRSGSQAISQDEMAHSMMK